MTKKENETAYLLGGVSKLVTRKTHDKSLTIANDAKYSRYHSGSRSRFQVRADAFQ
jgi:hypothetical protein